MQKSTNLTKIICEIGIFSAIGYILDEFQSIFFKGVFVNGGSIGFAMIAVLIIGYRRGFLPALLTGLIMGLFDLATGAFIIHPAQLLLDYLLSYAVVAIGILFKPAFDKSENHKILFIIIGSIVGGLAKLLCHFLSGAIFWNDIGTFAWGLGNLSPYLYSFIYNFAFIGPSILITTLLLLLIFKKGNKIFIAPDSSIKNKELSVATKSDYIASISTICIGLFLFIFFLIRYIESFNQEVSADSISYSFSKDSMVIFILGIFTVIGGTLCLVRNIKKMDSKTINLYTLIFVTSISTIYGLTELIKVCKKGTNYVPYIIWLLISMLLLFITLIGLYKLKKNKN